MFRVVNYNSLVDVSELVVEDLIGNGAGDHEDVPVVLPVFEEL